MGFQEIITLIIVAGSAFFWENGGLENQKSTAAVAGVTSNFQKLNLMVKSYSP